MFQQSGQLERDPPSCPPPTRNPSSCVLCVEAPKNSRLILWRPPAGNYIIRTLMSEVRDTVTNFSVRGVYVSQDADDAALVRQCLDGDTASFSQIVERYQRVLFTVAVRMLGNYDEATDATQDAFVKAYR